MNPWTIVKGPYGTGLMAAAASTDNSALMRGEGVLLSPLLRAGRFLAEWFPPRLTFFLSRTFVVGLFGIGSPAPERLCT